jgi:hypothetical protein
VVLGEIPFSLMMTINDKRETRIYQTKMLRIAKHLRINYYKLIFF